jgi:hypothetical protein
LLSLVGALRALHSNLRADLWRRLPTVALAKVGRRFGWQAVASLGPRLRVSFGEVSPEPSA